jgi:hypothetical protein
MKTHKYSNVLAHKHLLEELSNKNSKYRITILKKADPKLILAICEVIYNILEGNVPLNRSEKEILSKDKKILRKLVEKNKITYKKKLLIQKGGFILPLLLPAALSAIASALFN